MIIMGIIVIVAVIAIFLILKSKREHYGPMKFTFRPPMSECKRICDRYSWNALVGGQDMDWVLRLRDGCYTECQMMQRG
jgi:hypothetical protein